MAGRVLSRPSARQLRATAFETFLGLTLILGLVCLCFARFGPLRGTFFDLYLTMSRAMRAGFEIAHLGAFLGFGVVWLASPELRYRYRWLCLFMFLLALLAHSQPA